MAPELSMSLYKFEGRKRRIYMQKAWKISTFIIPIPQVMGVLGHQIKCTRMMKKKETEEKIL